MDESFLKKEIVPAADLESAISLGFQSTMEYLQSGVLRESIKTELLKLNTSSSPSDSTSPEEIVYKKPEVNALAGYFMVPIWHAAKAWLEKNNGKLRRYGKKNKIIIEDVAESSGKFTDQYHLLSYLYKSSLETLHIQVDEYGRDMKSALQRLKDEGVSPTDWPTEIKNAVRYQTILPLSDFRQENFAGKPSVHIKSGFLAAQLVSWAMLASIPVEYEKTFGKSISQDDLKEYIAKGKTLSLYLASLHVQLLAILLKELFVQKDPNDKSKTDRIPLLKNVTLKTNGRFPFDVNADVLKRIATQWADIAINESRTGCPAIIARDGQQNLVSVLYDWNTELAQKYYFPFFKFNTRGN